MNHHAISQFNLEREDAFVFSDPEVYGGIEVAGTVALFDALSAKGLSPSVAAGPLLAIIEDLPDEGERALGVTLMTAAEASSSYPSGAGLMSAPTHDVGYAFSWDFEQAGDDITEVFVAIEPERLNSMKAASREEDLGRILSLNEAIVAQLILTGSADREGELSAAEEAAGPMLRAALEQTDELLLAIAPAEVS